MIPHWRPALLTSDGREIAHKGAGSLEFGRAVRIIGHVTAAPSSARDITQLLQPPSPRERRPPLAVAVIIFGPGGGELIETIRSAIPWLDRDTKHLLHFFRLGDPCNSGPNFHNYFRDVRYSKSIGIAGRRPFSQNPRPDRQCSRSEHSTGRGRG